MKSRMAVRILEDYMKTSADAVLAVVESVERLRMEGGGILSSEEAAAISVAMYGAPPKPSAGDVASIASQKRLVMENKSMADDVVLSMSVARYGIENNRSRAEEAAENIRRIMEETIASPYTNRDFVSMNDDNTPWVDCTKYKLVGVDKEITLASFQKKEVVQSAESNLEELLSRVQQEGTGNNLKSCIQMVATNISMNVIVSWANALELALKDEPSIYYNSRHDSKVKMAVKEIMSLVGKSYCRMATQLTSAQDISTFQRAADTCYNALMAETHKQIISNLLFFINFKIVEDNEKEYVMDRLGATAGTVKKPIYIERRDAAETLFGLCFMFKIMPPEFVDSVLTFPSADLSYHGRSGTRLTSLLSYYGPRFQDSWARFKNVLSERSRVVHMLHDKGSRIDYIDTTANLTGSVYVLVLDVANAFQAQRTCAYKFLNELKEQYRLWDKFVRATQK